MTTISNHWQNQRRERRSDVHRQRMRLRTLYRTLLDWLRLADGEGFAPV